MNTVKKLESAIVELLKDDETYHIGAAWDEEAMKTFWAEDGAVIVQVTGITPAHADNPNLPDFRAGIAVRGRTSMETDKDKAKIDRIASLVARKVAALTSAALSAATGATVAAWLAGGMTRAVLDDGHHFEIKQTMILLDLQFEG